MSDTEPPASEPRCYDCKRPTASRCEGCGRAVCEVCSEICRSCANPAPPEQPAPTFAELEAILDPLYDGATDKRRLLRDVRGWLANHCIDCGEFIGDKPWRCKCAPPEQPARGDGVRRVFEGVVKQVPTLNPDVVADDGTESDTNEMLDGLLGKRVRVTVEVLGDVPGKDGAR